MNARHERGELSVTTEIYTHPTRLSPVANSGRMIYRHIYALLATDSAEQIADHLLRTDLDDEPRLHFHFAPYVPSVWILKTVTITSGTNSSCKPLGSGPSFVFKP